MEEEVTTTDDYIRLMGYAFRDLTYHSDGYYTCRLGYSFMKGVRGTKQFEGVTPLEAMEKAFEALERLDLLEKDSI